MFYRTKNWRLGGRVKKSPCFLLKSQMSFCNRRKLPELTVHPGSQNHVDSLYLFPLRQHATREWQDVSQLSYWDRISVNI
jgi:hypothetical protein